MFTDGIETSGGPTPSTVTSTSISWRGADESRLSGIDASYKSMWILLRIGTMFISVNFSLLSFHGLKNFGRFFKRFANFWAKIFCSRSAETKILLDNVDMGIKLYLINFFDLCCQKIELM